MTSNVDELQKWDEIIREKVAMFGLKPFPQEFEICDHNEMLGYMAYSGMPSRYSHWSHGKNFERQKTLYDYGVSGLPYEMVINSNPCLAYLMRDNTLLLQILTIAHVYGHNDFFANNFTFTSATRSELTLEMFKSHANRINSYIEDPSIGIQGVEAILDNAHAVSWQTSRNLAIKKLNQEQQRDRAMERALGKIDPNQDIHVAKSYTAPELNRDPLEPDEDLLLFIAEHNPNLEEWQKDLLRIVDRETRYFLPQMETKIMNEGWASYWHHRILNELDLEQGLQIEFMVRHNQVLRPTPGGLNPYHLGFMIWHDIERRWNEGNTGREYTDDRPAVDPASLPENDTPGRKKMFEVRESDRDVSFLRRFLTEDLMRDLELFQHEKKGKDRVVTKVADEENWQTVKNTLIHNTGMNGLPVIKVIDADFGKNRTLQLKHYYDGRELQLEYAEHSLKHIQKLWGREVVLETNLAGSDSILSLSNGKVKVEKITR